MKLKLACADYTFPLLPFEAVLDLIAALEFKGVDIGLFSGNSHVDPDRVLNDIPSEARELGRRVADRGLAIADMFLTPGKDFETLAPNHPDPGERRRSRNVFERALEFTVAAGARHMTALPGAVFPAASLQENLDLCAEELSWRALEAAKAGVIFSIEPHIGSIVPTPGKVQELLDSAPGLSLSLDWAHLSSEGIADAEIEPLIAGSTHFHARCAREQRLQAPMSENTVDFPRILELMESCGYTGAISVEYVWIEWKNCNQVDNLSETVLLRDRLREIADGLGWER